MLSPCKYETTFQQFTEWFAQKVNKWLEEDKDLEDIDIKLTVSVLNLFMPIGFLNCIII